MREADESFLALAEPGGGEAAPGDHLQVSYQLWLVGHRLGEGGVPWTDPYSFRPATDGVAVFQGWLFGLPLWPLFDAFGPAVAWNVFTLLAYVLAGAFGALWLRALGLSRGAALVGGLAFALAPYRVAQSTGHLLGPLSALLPLALWGVETRRLVVAGAALTAIPLSGQLHLAIGAIPFVLAYALVRTRDWAAFAGAAAGAAAAAAVGLAVKEIALDGSISAQGRSLRAVSFFSPDWQDFLVREMRHPVPYGVEMVVFMGWLTPVLALVGLVLLARARRFSLAVLLGVGVAVPVWLALGTNVPTYELLWDALPPFRFPRVPERLMLIAVLCLAALVAYAAERARTAAAIAVLLVVIALDLRVELYGAAAADPDNGAYAALRERPAGRLVEFPVFPPERHEGSVFLYYAMQAPRERVAGYSTTAPVDAAEVVSSLRALSCGLWTTPRAQLLDRLGVRYVAFHAALYEGTEAIPAECAEPAARELERRGWLPVARDGPVVLYERR